jgi:quercetin dioxygenase-like cupin family protein
MAVQRWESDGRLRRQAIPGGPLVEVVIGAEQGLGLGVVDVTIPAGAAMPEHAHGGSEALLIPQAGRLRLVDAESGAVTELEPGVLATIPIGRRVALENPAATEARMLVVLAPPDFAATVAAWPVAASHTEPAVPAGA